MSKQEGGVPKRVRLDDGETVIYHGPANHVTNYLFGFNVGGRLYLTSHRLIFESSIGDGFRVLDLSEIQTVSKAATKAFPIPLGLVPNSIRLRDRHGEVVAQFVVKQRQKWITATSRLLTDSLNTRRR